MRQISFYGAKGLAQRSGQAKAAAPSTSCRIQAAAVLAALLLAGCQNGQNPAQVNRALASVNDIDNTNMADIMLTVGKPDEAVAFFRQAVANDPKNLDAQRGLGKSLMKAGKTAEAMGIWTAITALPEATHEDRVNFAESLIRGNDWQRAAQVLASIPPTYETFERYRLEAMVADSRKDWKKADSFYEIAAGMTAQPAPVLNNWGFSKLTRGEHAAAEKLFMQALTYDPAMFTAKNNLVLARAAQRKYDLPAVEATQQERAQLYYTAGLAAVKQGDPSVGRQLLQKAVETSPQYFEAAERSLAALGG